MIITRTPFRISFFGGGTDYPTWVNAHGGEVLSTAIDKYCYITCRHLPPFFEFKHRIVYSLIENVRHWDEIKHPAVRAVLEWAQQEQGLEIHHDGDLPARSGLGSSSSFTVGLVHALAAMKGRLIAKDDLARDAIHIEQDLIKENVGAQDQIAAAFGGFNRIEFKRCGGFQVSPVIIPRRRIDELQSHLMLCFTGLSRIASEVAQDQIANMGRRETRAAPHAGDGRRGGQDPARPEARRSRQFGELLHDGWMLKKELSAKVSTAEIDQLYAAARAGRRDRRQAARRRRRRLPAAVRQARAAGARQGAPEAPRPRAVRLRRSRQPRRPLSTERPALK